MHRQPYTVNRFNMKLPHIPPFKTKVVEPVYFRTKAERAAKIKEVHYNLFNLHSDWVIIDLMTDSGTGAMSEQQWAEIMLGDESYAGSESFFKLKKTIKDIMGFEYITPTHQGRAAENILFSAVVKDGDNIPGNAHFDTTKGHIEFRKAEAIDCTIEEAQDPIITPLLLLFLSSDDDEAANTGSEFKLINVFLGLTSRCIIPAACNPSNAINRWHR